MGQSRGPHHHACYPWYRGCRLSLPSITQSSNLHFDDTVVARETPLCPPHSLQVFCDGLVLLQLAFHTAASAPTALAPVLRTHAPRP